MDPEALEKRKPLKYRSIESLALGRLLKKYLENNTNMCYILNDIGYKKT